MKSANYNTIILVINNISHFYFSRLGAKMIFLWHVVWLFYQGRLLKKAQVSSSKKNYEPYMLLPPVIYKKKIDLLNK